MSLSRRKVGALSIAVLVALLVAWFVYDILAMPRVDPHQGDGRFANRSWRFPYRNFGLPIPGYTIDFDTFDLGKPLEATYRLKKLPALPNKIGVYLSIVDPEQKYVRDEARKPLAAAVEILVRDQNGMVVCKVNRNIASMVWAIPEGGRNTFGLYDLDQSFFAPTEDGQYELLVKYKPDPGMSGQTGFVHIRCGGSI